LINEKNSWINYFFFAVAKKYFCSKKINRQTLVERHTIVNNKFDSLTSLSVGNGGFAFTVDVTGLLVVEGYLGLGFSNDSNDSNKIGLAR
jgi:hypothetical protein